MNIFWKDEFDDLKFWNSTFRVKDLAEQEKFSRQLLLPRRDANVPTDF